MYNPTQNGDSHRYDYLYDPRTHTYASPAEMHYPAPNIHPLPLRPVNGGFHQEETPYQRYGQGQELPRTGQIDHQMVPYRPGDWAPHPPARLGISTIGHPELVPPQIAPHTSYHFGQRDHFDLYPISNRSITLDSIANRGRCFGNPPHSQSPARYQSSGTRTASPPSSHSFKKRHDPYPDRNDKPWSKARVGGPPKAPLGGIGGKPWDERIKDRTVSSPLPSTRSGTSSRAASTVIEEEVPTYKGNPIIFKPPPSTYFTDNPPKSTGANANSEGRERTPPKGVHLGPAAPPRGPPETIPLPPSPIDTDPERSGRRTWISISSTATMESSDGRRIKGKAKKVVVSLPNKAGWEEHNALVGQKARSQSIRDAILSSPTPAVQAGENESFEQSSNTISKEYNELEQAKSNPNTTPPHRPSTDDPPRVRSPPTPTRRGQSSTPQGNSAFVRRQLGGMLRSGPSSRTARAMSSTSSIQERQASDKKEGMDRTVEQEAQRRLESLADAGSAEEGSSADRVGPTVASSAYLTRVTVGPLGAKGHGALRLRQEMEDEISAPLASGGNSIDPDLQRGGLYNRPVQEGNIKDEVSTETPELFKPMLYQDPATRRQVETETTDPSAKRLRPTAEPWLPKSRHSSGSSNTADIGPKGKLRPTASAFTPRALFSNPSPSHVPVGPGDFTFRTENIKYGGMQSWSSVESDDRPIFGSESLETPTKEASIIDSSLGPKETSSRIGSTSSSESLETRSEGGSDDVKDDSSPGLKTPSDVEHTSHHGASEPSHQSPGFGLHEMDIPTARPFTSTGTEQSFSNHQRPVNPQGSPAAELHGIYASPGHSPPLSEISDTMEVLSDSFDPISYSYETDTESTYEVSSTPMFLTSTPRGGHRVLPIDSIQSDSESGRSTPEEYNTVPPVDVDQDPRRRFMECTFPNNHGQLPSIYRRHTFDQLNLTQSDEALDSPEQGVASTLASRVGDLRAHLAKTQAGNDDGGHLKVTSGPSGNLSTRSSAEFPMRSPNKRLTVVNSGEEEQEKPARLGPSVMADVATNGRDEVALRHAELTEKLTEISNALDSQVPLEVHFTSLTRMLEQQSILISSLANATQQNRSHQSDHLIPLLEGQQAVLEKLTTVESAQAEVTDRLAQLDDQQSEVIRELRLRIEEITAEKNEMTDRTHTLQLELLQSRHAQETAEKVAGEDRDKFQIAQSRTAALEQHLQSMIKENQSLTRGIEEDKKSRQDQTSRLENAHERLGSKDEELVAEKRRNEILLETSRSQTSELAELRHSTSSFQEMLVDRLSRIEEEVQGRSDHTGELAKMRARNDRLQEEVDSLKEQRLLDQREKYTEQTKSTATLRELEELRQQASSERDLRLKAEEKAETAEEALQKESVLRFQAQMMAKERGHHAAMQEVQLGARTRECNYWQTFALTYDRTAYRNYLKSKPFHGIDLGADGGGSNKSSSINKIPTYEELHGSREEPTSGERADEDGDDQLTPTKVSKPKGRGVATTMDEDREAWTSGAE